MNVAEIENLRRRLLEWYRKNRRDLPWRRTRDPYAIWVSEVMLQQTRVETVIDYYRNFLARLPDVSSLAAADRQEVLKLWEGLGYYARARNLHRAARIVCERYNGIVPVDPEAFRGLPGVGDYIAAAVLSIAFNCPLAVVDGNVKRVLSRLYRIDAPVNRNPVAPVFRQIADRLLDPSHPGGFNQALMELGALICRPGAPACRRCPLTMLCEAFAFGKQGEYPRRRSKAPVPIHRMAVGVIRRGAKILIIRRQEEGLLGGLWEFPAGRIHANEDPEAACVRSARNSVNLPVRVVAFLDRVNHAYSHFAVQLEVYCCRAETGRVRLAEAEAFRWIRAAEAGRYPFTGASHKILSLLRSHGCR